MVPIRLLTSEPEPSSDPIVGGLMMAAIQLAITLDVMNGGVVSDRMGAVSKFPKSAVIHAMEMTLAIVGGLDTMNVATGRDDDEFTTYLPSSQVISERLPPTRRHSLRLRRLASRSSLPVSSTSRLLDEPLSTGNATLSTVSLAAVPEPASWAMMMIGGFGLIGGTMRRQRKVTTAVRFA